MIDTFIIFDPHRGQYLQSDGMADTGRRWVNAKSDATRYKDGIVVALLKHQAFSKCLPEYAGTLREAQR